LCGSLTTGLKLRFLKTGGHKKKYVLLCILIILFGCSTYFQKNLLFHQSFTAGEIEKANEVLDSDADAAEGKNRLLFFMQKGVVLQLLGRYEESNKYLEQAYLYTEDLQTNYALEALSFLSNPTVKPYEGEDFEVVQIHYFKALNYLELGKYEEALVECRRLNIKLNELNDRYEDSKNRYRQDAFALNLVGIIYEASGEINNAFISYRNAYEVYRDVYQPHFGIEAPLQLKKDLLRSAYLNGFKDELALFEETFDMKYKPALNEGGELVFFMNNGLGPVKGEWSINFFIVKGSGGLVSFVNEEHGFNFPFSAGNGESSKLGDLKFVRVAFPKYIERKPHFNNTELNIAGNSYPLEMAQDINAIAFSTLEDRMLRELGNSLLRLAVKQAAEYALRQKNEGLGALLSIINSVTEKADTRNWQTLPYSIAYTRVPLAKGKHTMTLNGYSSNSGQSMIDSLNVDIKSGRTTFQVYHALDSVP
jgi:hypothetical protein